MYTHTCIPTLQFKIRNDVCLSLFHRSSTCFVLITTGLENCVILRNYETAALLGSGGRNCRSINSHGPLVTRYLSCTLLPCWSDKLVNCNPQMKLNVCLLRWIRTLTNILPAGGLGGVWWEKAPAACGTGQGEDIRLGAEGGTEWGTEGCVLWLRARQPQVLPKSQPAWNWPITQARNCTTFCTLS